MEEELYISTTQVALPQGLVLVVTKDIFLAIPSKVQVSQQALSELIRTHHQGNGKIMTGAPSFPRVTLLLTFFVQVSVSSASLLQKNFSQTVKKPTKALEGYAR